MGGEHSLEIVPGSTEVPERDPVLSEAGAEQVHLAVNSVLADDAALPRVLGDEPRTHGPRLGEEHSCDPTLQPREVERGSIEAHVGGVANRQARARARRRVTGGLGAALGRVRLRSKLIGGPVGGVIRDGY
jgi:hypothetical protein